MHARVEVRHAQEADGADDAEHAAGNEQAQLDHVDREAHGARSFSAVARIAEIAVPEVLEHGDRAEEVQQAVDDREVEKLRPAGEKADDREQQHGHGADGVGGLRAVEDRRPERRAQTRAQA